MKTKNKSLLILGIVLSLAGLIGSIVGFSGYHTNQESINASDPMFLPILLGLFALMCGIVVLVNALTQQKEAASRSTSEQVTRIAQAALFAALSYIGFQVFRFDIPVGTEKTAFHFGNTFVVLAALLLGGSWGGMAGAVGLTIADLTSGYATSAPKTFFLKLCIGLIAGFVAHHLFHITEETSKQKLTLATIVSAVCGMAFNVIADPLVGFFYKKYLFGIPQDMAATLAKISAVTTLVNAITSVLFVSLLYLALRPILIKAGLFVKISKRKNV
jgi:uncharacterized membrane protein